MPWNGTCYNLQPLAGQIPQPLPKASLSLQARGAGLPAQGLLCLGTGVSDTPVALEQGVQLGLQNLGREGGRQREMCVKS